MKVFCVEAKGRESFTVLSTEVPSLPPLVAAIPPSANLTVAKGKPLNFTVLLSEYGGFSKARIRELRVGSFRGLAASYSHPR